MRDIVERKSGTSQTEPTQGQPFVVPKVRRPSRVEKLLGKLNNLGGVLVRNYSQQEFVVAVQPDEDHIPLHTPVPAPKKRKLKSLRIIGHQTAAAGKKAGGRLKQEIKKPGRKTALVHTVALGVLFALVLNANVWQGHFSNDHSSLQSGASEQVRRYLPAISGDTRTAPLKQSEAVDQAGKPLVLHGWVTPWNIKAGTTDLYSAASAFWLTAQADGTVQPKANWDVWQSYRMKQGLSETYVTVTGDPNFVAVFLTDLDLQSKHIAALLTVVKEQNFDGVDINYEGLGSANRELFTAFVRNLRTVFQRENKKVAVTLEARIANQVPMDWQALGQIADEVRIMAYDYRSRKTNAPGPVAPLAWVAETVAYAVQRIDSRKLLIGLPNYGYDWAAPLDEHSSWEGIGLSYERAMALSEEHKSPVIRRTGIDERGYDIGSIPSFTYTDGQGRLRHVWFEDAISIQEKVNVVATYSVKGISFWSVGSGDPGIRELP
jgi:spore germination protein YaaH